MTLRPGVDAAPATEKVQGAVVENAPVCVFEPEVMALHALEPPLGVAHVPSPRQKVEDDALVPLLRFVTGRFPVTSAVRLTRLVVKTVSFTPSPVAEAAVWRIPADVNAPDGFKRILVKVAAGAAKPNKLDARVGMFPVPATAYTSPGVVPVAPKDTAVSPPVPV